MELAAALKKENPARTAAQVQRILRAQAGWAPDERTIQRMFIRAGLTALVTAGAAPAFGRFEASRPNEIWTGDALHSVRVAGRKTCLFAFIDDHSRAVMAARFGFAEDTIRLAAALRPALASRGAPEHVYVDNGSAFVDAWLMRACARLGIELVHSQPGRPQGRGKIERFFRTVRGQFLAELTEERAAQVKDLAELNRLFTAWAETVHHPPGALGDRAGAAGPLGGRRPVPPAGRRQPGRRVPLAGMADGHQDGHGVDARQPLPGRPGAGRQAGRAAARRRRSARPAPTTSPCSASSTTGRPPPGSTTPPSSRPPPAAGRRTPGNRQRRTRKPKKRQAPVTDSRPMAALARAAADAVRGLNHAAGGGLGQPSDAYDGAFADSGH